MRTGIKGVMGSVLALVLLTSCEKKEEGGSEAAVKVPFKTPFSCEEHWMVDRIANDLDTMATLAGANLQEPRQVKEISPHVYAAGEVKIELAPSCWDTETYHALVVSRGVSPGMPSPDDPKLRELLLTPTAANLQSVNLDLSKKLAASPADPTLHEQAALLLGTLALRENAGSFDDLRPLLCRSTAHLAFAAVLRKDAASTTSGRLAEILHTARIGRPIPAIEKAGKLPNEEIVNRWVRTLKVSVTGDFRQLQAAADRTLLETLVLARALRYHRGPEDLREMVGEDKELQALPDWARLLIHSGHSVEDGHLVMRFGPQLEVAEIDSIFKQAEDAELSAYTRSINLPVTTSLVENGKTAVISDGDWAHFFRRHLFHTVTRVHRFIKMQWGVPDTAVEWEKEFLPLLAKLPGGELAAPDLSNTDAAYQKRLAATRDFILSHPEAVPANLWFDYRFKSLGFESQVAMPAQPGWFRDVTPPDTAFDPCNRIRMETATGANWVNTIKRLHRMNPWDPMLCYELGENTGNNASSITEASKAISDFSILPYRQLVRCGSLSRPELIKTLTSFAEIDPSRGLELGQLLVLEGREKEAFDAYQKAFDDAADRVQVSNTTRWLMNYCLANGMDARAAEIANHNAEVYSASGLTCALMHAIHMKDLKKARELAGNLIERYGDTDYRPFIEWKLNNNEKALRKVFPDGLQTVAAADLDLTKPVSGVRLTQRNGLTEAAGLKMGDVICAINGQRLTNVLQYSYLMDLSYQAETTLLVKRGRKILEIQAIIPDRRLGVDIVAVP